MHKLCDGTSVTFYPGPMPGVSERPIQSPCGWCGTAIKQPTKGRLLQYCQRSCRQRAYEWRATQRLLQQDPDNTPAPVQPAERVIERVIQPRHPSTVAAWEQTLDELAAQLRTRRIPPWEAGRIRYALRAVNALLEETASASTTSPLGVAVPPQRTPLGERVPTNGGGRAGLTPAQSAVATYLAGLQAAGRSAESTTLEVIAGRVRLPVAVVRDALAMFVRAGSARALRRGRHVDVAELGTHQRFDLVVAGIW